VAKVTTEFCEKGRTKLVPCDGFKFEVFREHWEKSGRLRQYVVYVKWGDDCFTVTSAYWGVALNRAARLLEVLTEEK